LLATSRSPCARSACEHLQLAHGAARRGQPLLHGRQLQLRRPLLLLRGDGRLVVARRAALLHARGERRERGQQRRLLRQRRVQPLRLWRVFGVDALAARL
jgi:hypothetical protein